MLILFLISMLGHTLVHRNISVITQQFSLSSNIFRSIARSNLALFAVVTAIWSQSPASLWLFIGILLISLKLFPEILRIFLIKELSRALIPLLDQVIMGLQTGNSFRVSLRAAIENQGGWKRNQLREVYESVVSTDRTSDLKSAVLKDFLLEMIEIDASQSRSVDQVRALRRQLKMQEDFRRRSGQVTQQIKMQAIIVTALFLALLTFIIGQFGYVAHRNLIFGSVSIFIVGLIWIFAIGRRMKWKI